MGSGGFRELQQAHQTLAREHAQTRGITVSLVNLMRRGFWGRLRWLLTGK